MSPVLHIDQPVSLEGLGLFWMYYMIATFILLLELYCIIVVGVAAGRALILSPLSFPHGTTTGARKSSSSSIKFTFGALSAAPSLNAWCTMATPFSKLRTYRPVSNSGALCLFVSSFFRSCDSSTRLVASMTAFSSYSLAVATTSSVHPAAWARPDVPSNLVIYRTASQARQRRSGATSSYL